jgi:tetratricopeptide (TPR) repeat protein
VAPRRPAISNLAAYDYYLKARKDIFSYAATGLDRAIENLLQALEIVGENVILYRGLGMAFWQYCNAGIAPNEAFLDQVDVYADAIERMEPGHPSAATLRGLAHVQRGNLNESISNLMRAYQAEPYDPDVMLWLGAGLSLGGRTDLARPIITKLMSIDPLTPINHWAHAFVEFIDGNFDVAVARVREAVALVPDRLGMAWEHARFVAASGEKEQALEIIDQAFARAPEEDSVFYHMLQMLRAAITGDREGVDRACTDELRRMVSTDMEYPQSIADSYAIVGELDEALTWLRLAVQRGFINRRFLTEIDPFLEPLRPDPRFAEVMSEVDARNDSLRRTLDRLRSDGILEE